MTPLSFFWRLFALSVYDRASDYRVERIPMSKPVPVHQAFLLSFMSSWLSKAQEGISKADNNYPIRRRILITESSVTNNKAQRPVHYEPLAPNRAQGRGGAVHAAGKFFRTPVQNLARYILIRPQSLADSDHVTNLAIYHQI